MRLNKINLEWNNILRSDNIKKTIPSNVDNISHLRYYCKHHINYNYSKLIQLIKHRLRINYYSINQLEKEILTYFDKKIKNQNYNQYTQWIIS